jgi:S1-C subfamily serine protease
MIPRLILSRVFHIRQSMGGSAFSVEIEGRQYVVTAKHLVERLSPGGTIEYEGARGWITIPITGVWHHPDPTVDVSVVTLPEVIGRTGHIELSGHPPGPSIGETVFLAGFPYSMSTIGPNADEPPLPLVKHGVFSGLEPRGTAPYRNMIFDALSNPGFSGGPVVYRQGDTWVIVAVATSTMAEPRQIDGIIQGGVGPAAPAPVVNLYTGFMIGVPIKYAEEGAAELGDAAPAIE